MVVVWPWLLLMDSCLLTFLHPNISIVILLTLLYTLPLELTRRIDRTIKASSVGNHFFSSHEL